MKGKGQFQWFQLLSDQNSWWIFVFWLINQLIIAACFLSPSYCWMCACTESFGRAGGRAAGLWLQRSVGLVNRRRERGTVTHSLLEKERKRERGRKQTNELVSTADMLRLVSSDWHWLKRRWCWKCGIKKKEKSRLVSNCILVFLW